jgi:glutamate synthase (ferredoxin)
LVIAPPKDSHPSFVADRNIIVGNTCFYGATSGEAFMAGVAGERFCVRNSGAHTVIEGIGDHGCEYMTGGSVTCLGGTGRNFAAGMSGGVAYVYDENGDFESKLNRAMVNLYPLIECRDIEIEELRGRIQRHVELTGSLKGQKLLQNWKESLPKFFKVLPADYERVLNALEEARQQGLEGDDAILAAFEANAKVGH